MLSAMSMVIRQRHRISSGLAIKRARISGTSKGVMAGRIAAATIMINTARAISNASGTGAIGTINTAAIGATAGTAINSIAA